MVGQRERGEAKRNVVGNDAVHPLGIHELFHNGILRLTRAAKIIEEEFHGDASGGRTFSVSGIATIDWNGVC